VGGGGCVVEVMMVGIDGGGVDVIMVVIQTAPVTGVPVVVTVVRSTSSSNRALTTDE